MDEEDERKDETEKIFRVWHQPLDGWASQVALVVKNQSTNADLGSIPGLGRYPGGGHGNPLQYSCRDNPMDRGPWWATVHRVTKSRTQLTRLTVHAIGWTVVFFTEMVITLRRVHGK